MTAAAPIQAVSYGQLVRFRAESCDRCTNDNDGKCWIYNALFQARRNTLPMLPEAISIDEKRTVSCSSFAEDPT